MNCIMSTFGRYDARWSADELDGAVRYLIAHHPTRIVVLGDLSRAAHAVGHWGSTAGRALRNRLLAGKRIERAVVGGRLASYRISGTPPPHREP